MKILEVHIDGFGKLVDRTFTFSPTLNLIVGENEAGKSTLSSAILALLYGLNRGEKERWRPWTGQRYSARLTYELSDGRKFEVQRDFDRDSKGVRVYDEHGNDASGECTIGKTISPGEVHLGLPLEVFVNASFLAQGDATIDGSRAERITHSLARALDGGPREDAALGAIGRLEAALAVHVGKKRATVNAPLKHLYDEIDEAQERADTMRAHLRELDDLRSRLEFERAKAMELEGALKRHELEGRALRAYTLRSRIESLRNLRDDLAALSAERAQYDDVESFPLGIADKLEASYRDWHTHSALARNQSEEALRARMTPALLNELEERNADGGSLDDDAFAELSELTAAAMAARNQATAAADRAQAARRNVDGGSELFGALLSAGALIAVAAVILYAVKQNVFAIVAAILAIALFGTALIRSNGRRTKARIVREMQREADASIAAERQAAERVAAVLAPLGVVSLEEITRKRERAIELRKRKAEAERLATAALETNNLAEAAGRTFDALAVTVIETSGVRDRDLDIVEKLEARKRARDGIDLRLSMIDVRRGDLLGEDDEFALEAELRDLLLAGVVPHAPPDGSSARAFEAQQHDLRRRTAETERGVAALEAHIELAHSNVRDLAMLDEAVTRLRFQATSLERFEESVELARSTIDKRTKEAHHKFAQRLSDYASQALEAITLGRYAVIRIDPTTLTVRVRSPENHAIIDADVLSAGTREQAYLVTRFAMAQMFSEGLEPAPVLLDDPFAYWDDERIKRSMPVMQAFVSAGNQLIILKTSDTSGFPVKGIEI